MNEFDKPRAGLSTNARAGRNAAATCAGPTRMLPDLISEREYEDCGIPCLKVKTGGPEVTAA